MGYRRRFRVIAALISIAWTASPIFAQQAGEEFDALAAGQQLSEKSIPPEKIFAWYSDQGKVYRTRPVCAFPKTAVYKDSGGIYDAASFECVNP
jgi:feruloyl esterase